jgi:hypothetical protein
VANHAGEVPVNPGGEPGRDDSGLPPVDIEIPDDARELDRDVLAYRREMRAQRRRARWHKLLGPLRGHGAILPLIASCVALSMVAGALLSVFTISPASAPVVPRSPAPTLSFAPAPAAGADDSELPAGNVLVNGKSTSLRMLVGAVLALVPARGCKCDAALKELTTQAARAGVTVYYVGTATAMADVARLVKTDGHGNAVPVQDARNVLGSTYQPDGLTAVLVHADASTTVQKNLTPGLRLEDQLRTLGGGQSASSGARTTSPAPGTT